MERQQKVKWQINMENEIYIVDRSGLYRVQSTNKEVKEDDATEYRI